jgi:hypothetical protein
VKLLPVDAGRLERTRRDSSAFKQMKLHVGSLT